MSRYATTPAAVEARRAQFSVPQIEQMVHTFYGRVRADEVLGPIFESRIEDWDVHLGRMVGFWRAVLRHEPTFSMSPRGGPPAMHQAIEELTLSHFGHWLQLFRDVVTDVFEPSDAEAVWRTAANIAGALSRHLEPDAPQTDA